MANNIKKAKVDIEALRQSLASLTAQQIEAQRALSSAKVNTTEYLEAVANINRLSLAYNALADSIIRAESASSSFRGGRVAIKNVSPLDADRPFKLEQAEEAAKRKFAATTSPRTEYDRVAQELKSSSAKLSAIAQKDSQIKAVTDRAEQELLAESKKMADLRTGLKQANQRAIALVRGYVEGSSTVGGVADASDENKAINAAIDAMLAGGKWPGGRRKSQEENPALKNKELEPAFAWADAQGIGRESLSGTPVRGVLGTKLTFEKEIDGVLQKVQVLINKLGQVEPLPKSKVPALSKDLDEAAKKAALANEKYKKLFEEVERRGGSRADLVRINRDLSGGNEELIFKRKNEFGVNVQQSAVISPSGQVGFPTQRKFRSPLQELGRDVVQFATWSAAMQLVTVPIQKAMEMMEQLRNNEEDLVETTIAVSSQYASLSQIFDTVSDAADRAGKSIHETVEAFTLAYRATGGGENEVERYATATVLLDDALVLSKLSALDQATALDTLAASLRQTAKSLPTNEELNPLERGRELIDKWVKTSQVANVDLGTLATGFAVLGDAAEAASINIDELNGILAAVAETGISSGKETANAARALVAGVQSDKAIAELNRLGIATKDSTGQMRGFMDIMRQIKSLRDTRILEDSDFSKLTLALGGGTRRQAVYTTFISNLSRVDEVAAASSSARGEAGVALSKQLDTVNTASQRLENSFQSLGMTLGQDGGFLDATKSALENITKIIDGMNLLVSAVGRATPTLLALGAAFAFLKTRTDPQAFIGKNILSPLASGIDRGAGIIGYDPTMSQRMAMATGTPAQTPGQRFINFLSGGGSRAGLGAFAGIAMSAFPAISNYTNENDQFGKLKAGADIAGGIVGGVVGSLAGPQGAVIGSAIGISIAEAFVNKTIAYETRLANFFHKLTLQDANKPIIEEKDYEAAREALFADYSGKNNSVLGRAMASSDVGPTQIAISRINEAIRTGDLEALKRVQDLYNQTSPELLDNLKYLGVSFEDAAGEIRKPESERRYYDVAEITPEAIAMAGASEEARNKFKEISNQTGFFESGMSPFEKQLSGMNSTEVSNAIQKLVIGRIEELSRSRSSGELKSSTYGSMKGAVSGFGASGAMQYLTAFGEQFRDIDSVEGISKSVADFLDIVAYGSRESVDELNALTGEIIDLTNKVGILNDGESTTIMVDGTEVVKTKKELEELLDAKKALAAGKAEQILLDVRIARADLPQIVGGSTPISRSDADDIFKRGMELQDEYYGQFLDDSLYEEVKSRFEKFAQYVEEGGKTFYKVFEGLDSRWYNKALQEKESGDKGIGFSQFDFSRSTLEAAALHSINVSADWERRFGYKPEVADQIVIDKDGVAKPLKAEFKIMQMLLEKLVEQGQKQLDGMYNIPEGATFWVPLQASYYKPGTGDSGTKSLEEVVSKITSEGSLPKEGLEDPLIKYPKKRREDETRFTTKDERDFLGRERRELIDSISSITKEKTPLENTVAAVRRYGEVGSTEFPPKVPEATMANLRRIDEMGGVGRDNASNTTPTARLQLTINSSTVVQVDGRQVATAIKQFLANDLLRMSSAYGQSTKNYVI